MRDKRRCPECGAPINAYGTPDCGCAIRSGAVPPPGGETAAGETRREPQLIRPYVMQSPDQPVRAPEETRHLPLPKQAFLPSTPDPDDLDRFEGEPAASDDTTEMPPLVTPGPDAPHGPPPRGRRTLVIAAAAGAVLLVAGVAAALVASSPEENEARPDRPEVTSTGNPAPSADASSAAPSASPSKSPTQSASASPSESPSAGASASPSPSAAKTTQPAPPAAPTLSRGSSGAEVEELQSRLRQVLLYLGPIDGDYDAQVVKAVSNYQDAYNVTGDANGVYGPNTRRSLEDRTTG